MARGRGSCGLSKQMPMRRVGSTGQWSTSIPRQAAPINMPPEPATARRGYRADADGPPITGRTRRLAAHAAGSRPKSTRRATAAADLWPSWSLPGSGVTPPQMIPVLDGIRVSRPAGGRPRMRPEHVCGDKACSSRRNRRYLRRRQIRHTIPERRDQRANRQRRGSRGGRPTNFDQTRYARRNEVERTVNALKGSRAVATGYEQEGIRLPGHGHPGCDPALAGVTTLRTVPRPPRVP